MASTYVNNLRVAEPADGDSDWGTSTNTSLELIGEALGIGSEAITTNADTHTSTVADGSTDAARAFHLKYTGTLDSTCTITIAPNTMKRVQIIENATSGSQSIVISQGSGANVTIGTGSTKMVYLDGAGAGAAVVECFFGDSSVVTDKIATDAITSAKIADDAVGADQLAASAVVTASIVDDAITSAKIADDAITSALIADDAVGADQLASDAVVTASIVDDAVTLAKMASGTDGNIISCDASGNPVAVATGNAGQVLTSAGAGSPPTFADAASSGVGVGQAFYMGLM